jgi:hypothetical protein
MTEIVDRLGKEKRPIKLTHYLSSEKDVPCFKETTKKNISAFVVRDCEKLERVSQIAEYDVLIGTISGEPFLFLGHWNDGVI